MPTEGIQYCQVTLTSAQVKSCRASPVTLVAAPGAGRAILIVGSAMSKMTYGGSNVFVAAASQNIHISFGPGLNALTGAIVPNSNITGAVTRIAFSYIISGSGFSTAQIENVALFAYNNQVTEISGNAANNNTITISFMYYIVTL